MVEVDHDQIQRVLANLVTNAVEATGSGGVVEISVGQDARDVWIEVADNGPGISPADRERVFDPLYTTKPTGVGLGLALSRRYVEGNRGSLRVTDCDSGGACFRLTLPRWANKHDRSEEEE
jgi:signal transduction histidine kinase